MRLVLLHPEVAARDCRDCVAYLYHDRGPTEFGPRVERGGKPVPRPKGTRPPCHWCPKVPPDAPPTPASACDLSDANLRAWEHHRECAAVGAFPADAIVRRNAALIAEAERQADRVRQTRTGLAVLGALTKGL